MFLNKIGKAYLTLFPKKKGTWLVPIKNLLGHNNGQQKKEEKLYTTISLL